MPKFETLIHPQVLADLLRLPVSEVHAALAGEPAGHRPYWAAHALKIAAGILQPDAPQHMLPPRPGKQQDLSQPWGCLSMACGGWMGVCQMLGTSRATLQGWQLHVPSCSVHAFSKALRASGLRPFFQLDWQQAGNRKGYVLAFRRPTLTAQEVADGK